MWCKFKAIRLFIHIDLKTFPPRLLYISLKQNLSEQLLKVMGGKTRSLCPWLLSPEWGKTGFGQIPGGAKVPSEGTARVPATRGSLRTEGIGTQEGFSPAQQKQWAEWKGHGPLTSLEQSDQSPLCQYFVLGLSIRNFFWKHCHGLRQDNMSKSLGENN